MNKDELVANLGTIARSGSKVWVVFFLILRNLFVFLHKISAYTDNVTNTTNLSLHTL